MEIGFVAHDAGGAELLSSYALENCFSGKFCVSGPAIEIFSLKFEKFHNYTLEEVIADSDLIMTGTGWASNFEWNAIRTAKIHNKRVISFLDHWCNYRDRFIRNGISIFPDKIWVGDVFALKIAQETFPNLEILLVENPFFKRIKKSFSSFPKKNLTGNHKVLYVSEPILDADKHGYSEREAINYFFQKLPDIVPSKAEIIFRKHPSENKNKYDWIFEFSSQNISFSNNVDLLDDLRESDIVIGRNSMALVAALMADKKVFSLIPPGGGFCILPFSEIIQL
ncbi:hypothetical protein VC178_01495 [Polynucleobacter sp. AP-Sanab-80-C2]|uniref:hypothetical protein n=1 Tax=Polynucleobacter sp. AP-Sanab-80-C2 TaxID=3108274 RepID=UPI002B232F77|nr:hypothetical protein [Polynucleobacter sp. AP-Sanab-80-C2]MEA9598568.1 hypothetical protein [Polynucleobacter sp. AP-Sanab-80-C2]